MVLSLTRLNRIREVDAVEQHDDRPKRAQRSKRCRMQRRQAERLFPLSLGSEGSCTIGGNLATNAGGVGVLAYGNARALTLGARSGARRRARSGMGCAALRKDNTGYDLKDVFIGSEGTLGVITAAVLIALPPTARQGNGFRAVESVKEAAVDLFDLANRVSGRARDRA